LEIYKIIQDKEVVQLRNTFSNLALPLFTSMEPEPPKVTKSVVRGKEWKWTQWDRVDVKDPDLTVEGLIGFLSAEYGVQLSMLSSGVTILYSDFLDRKKMKVHSSSSTSYFAG
jgi:ubiquitin-activating enzyme E1